MKKRLVRIAVLLIGIGLNVFAVNNLLAQKITENDYYGSWTSNASWVDNVAIATSNLPPGNYDIIINGYINVGSFSTSQDLTFSASNEAYDFVVNDTLVVYGNVDFANKAMNLVINAGGLFIILGDLEMNNKIDVASSGSLVVKGTFNKTGTQGTYTGTGNVYAGAYTGDAEDLVPDGQEKNTGSDLLNDLPDVFDFINSGGEVPLPVELLYFKAIGRRNTIATSWKTATELNNDYFTLEKSKDGIEYHSIGTVQGFGTTNLAREYEFIDEQPTNGLSYYRLRQTDFDGTTEVFRPVSIVFEGGTQDIVIFPNPVTNNELNISSLNLMPNSVAHVMLLDVNGRKVFSTQFMTNAFGALEEKIDIKTLPKGSYIFRLMSDHKTHNLKLFIQ